MRIYISGPITGEENFIETFDRAAELWRGRGHQVINPAHMSRVISDASWEDFMELDLDLLARCDAIYMLRGWKKSRGALKEYGYAMGAGMLIVEEEMLDEG